MLLKALELQLCGWRPNNLKQTPVILPYLTGETLQELNSPSCFCCFAVRYSPCLFHSLPPSKAQLFFPMLWLKLPPISVVLYQEHFVLGSKGKMQLLDAAPWSPCWEFLFPYNTSLPRAGSGNAILTLAGNGITGAGMIVPAPSGPICIHTYTGEL